MFATQRRRPRPRRARTVRLRWWWHRHPATAWVASVVAIAVLVHLFGSVGPPATSSGDPSSPGATTQVAVATRPLAAGERIADADIAWELRPTRTLSGDPVADPVGQRVAVLVLAGEPVVAERLAPSGLSSTASRVPTGGRAIAIPHAFAVPPVAVGDRVDVLIVGTGGFTAVTAAREVPVIATDEQAVTVAVPAAAAPTVTEGLASGLVTLALLGAEP